MKSFIPVFIERVTRSFAGNGVHSEHGW
jgi:hypothetical protein